MDQKLTLGSLLLGGMLSLAVLPGCSSSQPMGSAKKEAPLPLVTVAKPTVKTMTQFTEVTGTMQARERVEVRPQVSGYIEKVHFKDGEEVSAGQLLVSIEPSIFQAELDRAKGELAAAEASAKQAVSEEARDLDLAKKNAISVAELEKAIAQREITAANVLTAKANLDRAAKNLEWTKVTARIAGRVDRIFITEGNLITAGSSVLTILTSTDPIFAYFEIDEETVLYYLKLIAEGKFTSVRQQAIPFEFALKGEEGYPHRGELDFASTEMNAGTGTLTLRGVIPNPAPYRYTSGMFVKARLPGAMVENAILIPDTAIVIDQDRRVVFTVNSENRIQAKPVKIGPRSDGLRVVLEGLNPDDTIVVRGMQRVRDGAPVETIEAK